MVVRLEPVQGPIEGWVPLPYSKSISARHILMGLHSGAPFTIEGLSEADDTQKLLGIVRSCGYRVRQVGNSWHFEPERPFLPAHLEVGEGGTTLRFILPWLAGLPGKTHLHLGGRLSKRPLAPLVQALVEAGAQIEATGEHLQITGNPDWRPSVFRIDSRLSGQFLSAIFLMAPRLSEGSEVIETSGEPATLSYVESFTLTILRKAGYVWEKVAPGHWILSRANTGSPHVNLYIGEADWSAAGYFWGWAMGAGARLELPVSLESHQPERAFWAGGSWPLEITEISRGVRVISSGEILPLWAGDIASVPDAFPTLAVLAALAGDSWSFRGIRTLPYKESHRLLAMQAELDKMGARLEWTEEVCRVYPGRLGKAPLHLYTHGDHRVAMALSLLASRWKAPLYIHGAEVVAKSFPRYWEVLGHLGISLTFEA
jgi:3-phosphoshikimate 1-carboxyvinyltransferase